MTKRDLQQLYALTRLPGWELLMKEVRERALTKVRQQWDKTGEKLAQATGRAIEAADLHELLVGYEKPGKDEEKEED